jgi:WD40 repeat protein
MKRSQLALGLVISCIVLVTITQLYAQTGRRSPRVLTSLTDVIWTVQFSPDGRTLAIARGTSEAGRVELWDIASGKLKHSIQGFDGAVWSISFTPDGRTMVSGSGGFHSKKIADKAGRRDRTPFVELKWWNTETGDLKQRVELPGDDRVGLTAVHSPDGRYLATVEYHASVGLYSRFPTGAFEPGRPSMTGVMPMRSVIFDTDLKLLDAATGELRLKFKGNMGMSEIPLFSRSSYDWEWMAMGRARQSIAISPDGQVMAAWNAKQVKLWSTGDGEEIHKLKDFRGYLTAAAFSPDGRTLAATITRHSFRDNRSDTRSEIRTWDVASGAPKQVVPVTTQSSSSLVFALNGQQLLVSGMVREEGRPFATLELADLQTGSLGKIATREEGSTSSAVLSPDGRMVAFQTDASSVYLVDTVSWKIKHAFNESSDPGFTNTAARRFLLSVKNVTTLAFSADGKTVSGEIEQGGIKLWDPRTGEVKKHLGDQDETGSTAAISANGNIVVEAGSDEGTLHIWNVATGEKRIIAAKEGSVSAIALSSDGQKMAVAYPHWIVVLDTATGALLKTLDPQTTVVDCLSFAADGQTLAAAGEDGQIQTWDLAGGRVIRTITGAGKVTTVRFAPGGRGLASAAADGIVSLWDLQTGALGLQLKKHSGPVNAIAFSADGTSMATGGDDRSVIVWELATGKVRRTLKGHDLTVTSLAFSPDGSLLASGAGNASVVLWDMPSGKLNRVMK